jgi:lysosomal acid lipase/cholesteryl ester hydrolase
VHRIKTEGAKPILMQHGIDAGSSEWISNSAEESPAFKMARAGYDVWLGNNRGNYLSKKNIYRGHETAEYWNFD